MKKWLLPVALGTVTLSACSVAFIFGLTSAPDVRTEYRIAGTNTYVGCQVATFAAVPETDANFGRANRINTQVRVSFKTNADLEAATIRLVGSNGKDNGFVKTYQDEELAESGTNYTVKFEAQPASGSPLPMGIIPVPKNEKIKEVSVLTANEKGYFVAEVTATTGSNPVVTAVRESNRIKVYSQCNVTKTTNEDI